LTTFAQDPRAQGTRAARVLLGELAGQAAQPWFAPEPVTFIDRGSAGPVAP
jgi:DNA-binding LacI/PurR family transcriptional regulator